LGGIAGPRGTPRAQVGGGANGMIGIKDRFHAFLIMQADKAIKDARRLGPGCKQSECGGGSVPDETGWG
jgi:hypothetical protein